MSNEPIDPKILAMMPPANAVPSHEPLPGADEALATGQSFRVQKQNCKTLPRNIPQPWDPFTGQPETPSVDEILDAAKRR